MIGQIEKSSNKKIIFMIILLFVPLFFFYLGIPSLWDEDESIYAEISRQMVLRHDYIGTFFNYMPRYDKPPLNFWVNAAFYKVLGMNELTTRLGSTLFALLCLILVYLFGRRLFNKRTGILAAMMLGTGLLFFVESQMALIDTSLTFFIGLTLYFFYRGFTEKKPYLYLFMGAALGLGILAKGPVTLVITATVAFIYWLFQTVRYQADWRKLWNRQLVAGFIIAAAICLPWYIMMWSRFGMDFIQSHFGYHMFKRFTEPIEHHGGTGWYYNLYYIVLLFFGFMPWSTYLPSSLKFAFKQWSESRMFFLLTWVVITFGFFTAAQTKLPGYTLPLFIPCALLMGYWWDQLLTGKKLKAHPWWGFLIQLLTVSGIASFIAINQSALPKGYQGLVWVIFLFPLSLIIGALLIKFWPRQNKSHGFFFTTTFFTYYFFWALFLLLFVPNIENYKPVRYLAADLHPYLKAGDKIISAIPGSSSAPFYTRHKIIFISGNDHLSKYCREKPRIFAFINQRSLTYLKQRKLIFYQLSHYGSGYLISNKPL